VVLLVLGVALAQQLNGSENALYYTPSLLQAAGYDLNTLLSLYIERPKD
jgi:hypothetical protein